MPEATKFGGDGVCKHLHGYPPFQLNHQPMPPAWVSALERKQVMGSTSAQIGMAMSSLISLRGRILDMSVRSPTSKMNGSSTVRKPSD